MRNVTSVSSEYFQPTLSSTELASDIQAQLHKFMWREVLPHIRKPSLGTLSEETLLKHSIMNTCCFGTQYSDLPEEKVGHESGAKLLLRKSRCSMASLKQGRSPSHLLTKTYSP
jgi:hypothetical protein